MGDATAAHSANGQKKRLWFLFHTKTCFSGPIAGPSEFVYVGCFMYSAMTVHLMSWLGILNLKESWKYNWFCPEVYPPIHLLLEKEITASTERSWSLPPGNVTLGGATSLSLRFRALWDCLFQIFEGPVLDSGAMVQLFEQQTECSQ